MRKNLILYYIWQYSWAFSICQSTFSDLSISAASATSTEDESSLISSSKEPSSSLLSSRDFSSVPIIFQRNSTSQDTSQEESESERDSQSSASHTHHLPSSFSASSSSLDTDTKDSFYVSQLQDESYATHKFNMNTCVGTCLGSASNLPQCAGRELYRGQFLCYGLTRVGLSYTGNFVYREYLTSSSLTPSVEVVLFAGFAEYLRLRSGGNLVLRNSDDDDLWETNTGNGFMFLIDNLGYRLINSSYQTIWTGNTDNNFRDGYCVFGNCLGGSATGCPQYRELYRGQFLCHYLTSGILTRVGLKSNGFFVYEEYINESDTVPNIQVLIVQSYQAEKLRLRSGGSLELQDYDDDDLWKISSSSGYKFILDSLGYRLISQYGQIIWDGDLNNDNDDIGNPVGRGCVLGNCLGGSATGCPQYRELFQGQFLCHQLTTSILTQVGITADGGELVYQEFLNDNLVPSTLVELRSFVFAKKLRLRSGGNLELFDYGDQTIWETNTDDGYKFLIDASGYRVVNEYNIPLWIGPLNEMMQARGCVLTGNCLGGSSSGCSAGRELYRGQFLCHTLTNFPTILTQVGLTTDGRLVYQEYYDTNSVSPGLTVPITSYYSNPYYSTAEKLRLRSGGSLELQDFDGDDLWKVPSNSGFRFLIDDDGYRLISQYGQTIWNGPITPGVPTLFSQKGCVRGNCLGAKSNGCMNGRDLYNGQFLCHMSDDNTILSQVGIDSNGYLIYREYYNDGSTSRHSSSSSSDPSVQVDIYDQSQAQGRKLRLQTNGSLVLSGTSSSTTKSTNTADVDEEIEGHSMTQLKIDQQEQEDKTSSLWSAGVESGYKLILDSSGYYVQDGSGQRIWTGSTSGVVGGGGGSDSGSDESSGCINCGSESGSSGIDNSNGNGNDNGGNGGGGVSGCINKGEAMLGKNIMGYFSVLLSRFGVIDSHFNDDSQ